MRPGRTDWVRVGHPLIRYTSRKALKSEGLMDGESGKNDDKLTRAKTLKNQKDDYIEADEMDPKSRYHTCLISVGN